MKRNLQGMIVVITGASAGIGRELAVQLSSRGARLVLAARRVDKLKDLNAQLSNAHLVLGCDVSIQADCETLIDATIMQFGRIDTLVCNAGYGELRRVADTTHEQFDAIFRTNVYGTHDCIRAAVPHMVKQDPRAGHRAQIMIVSSAAARRGLPFFGPYSATKAAQLSLSEALRVELKPRDISVTSVHPVGTDTDFFNVAEQRSGRKLPKRKLGDHMQSSAHVAARMIRAIEIPRPEVWPFRPVRYALLIAMLFPRLADRIMHKARGSVARSNPAIGD